MKTLITTDSSSDFSKEILEARGIKVLRLNVVLGNNEYVDGVTITPSDIFEFVKLNKKLPKTAALTEDQFKNFFKECLKDADQIVHIGLSSKLSVQYTQSLAAAAAFKGKVIVIDSLSLSMGTGLLCLAAQDLADAGKTAEEIAEIVAPRALKTQTSFVIQDTEYLYRGGRCSGIAMIGANLLKLKPRIQLVDGAMQPNGMFRGKMNKVLKEYIDKLFNEYTNIDKTRCAITHSTLETDIVNETVEYIKSKNIFKEVLVTTAGATITSHCGKGTLGLFFINDANNEN